MQLIPKTPRDDSHHAISLARCALKEELDDLRTIMTMNWPFLASLLRRCRIIADQNIDAVEVTPQNEIKVNPVFLRALDAKSKLYIYAKEALHIALSHPSRMQGKEEMLGRIGAESVVNSILELHDLLPQSSFPYEIVTAKHVARLIRKKEEDVTPMSFEERYFWLLKHWGKRSQSQPQNQDSPLGHRIMPDLSRQNAPQDDNPEGQKNEKKNGQENDGVGLSFKKEIQ